MPRKRCKDAYNHKLGRSDVGSAKGETGVKGKDTMPGSYLASRRAERCDTLIASALLVALIAGWIMNFVSVKQLEGGLDSFLAHTSSLRPDQA
jgi:hypothetical protein